MRSTQLALDRYDTEKVAHRYLERYDPLLQDWIDRPVALLELGIHKGGSLQMWRDYFPLGTIAGIDIRLPPELEPHDRIRMFQGSQADPEFLSRVAAEVAPAGFDVIIDDASHIGALTSLSFWHLFDHHLKPGGLYAIEDWGTGYWDDWPDGKRLETRMKFASASTGAPFPCHSYGMVGFVKQLIDEQAAPDVTQGCFAGRPTRSSKFKDMLITPSIVFVRKS